MTSLKNTVVAGDSGTQTTMLDEWRNTPEQLTGGRAQNESMGFVNHVF